MTDTHFTVKGHSEDFKGSRVSRDTVKSRTGPRNKVLSWKIQDGWSIMVTLSMIELGNGQYQTQPILSTFQRWFNQRRFQMLQILFAIDLQYHVLPFGKHLLNVCLSVCKQYFYGFRYDVICMYTVSQKKLCQLIFVPCLSNMDRF